MGTQKLVAAVDVRDPAVDQQVKAALEALGCEVAHEPGATVDIVLSDFPESSYLQQQDPEEEGAVRLPYRVRLLHEDEPLPQAMGASCDDVVRYCRDFEELKLRLQARLRLVEQTRRLVRLEQSLSQAVAKLQSSEERFRTLVESITDVFYVTDANGRLVYGSPNLFSYTGYQPRELLHRTYLKLVAPEDRRWLVALYLAKTAEGASEVACEFQALRKDGSRVWVDQRTTIVRDRQGRVVEYRNVVRDISERKAMEEALKEGEERYRSLYENVAIGLYRTTPDGRILMANPALVHMLGFESFEELAQRNLEEEGFEPGYPRALFRQRLESEGQIVGLESAWKRRDGSVIYVRESARAVKDESGRVLYYEGTAEDITERVTAEKALTESEERYRLISEMISDYAYAFRVEADGTMRGDWLTESFTKVFGWTVEELERRGGWVAAVYPPDLPLWVEHAGKVLHGQPDVTEGRFVTRDGEVRWLRDYAVPIFDPAAGRVTRIVGASEDITEKRKLEEALEESNELFRALADAAPAAVLVLQGDRLLYANKFAKNLVGFSDVERRNEENFDVLKLVDPAFREQVRSRGYARERGEPAPNRYELPIRTRDGKRRWLDFSVVTFPYRGQPARMAVAVDITDKKLTEEQLLHAQKMEAIGRLAGSVAHDFNNMLLVIMAHAELLKLKAGQDPRFLAAVDGILGASTRAAELTRKLLAFARKQQVHPERLDLNHEVGGTLKVLMRLLGENVELIWRPAEDLWPVVLDRSQVDQVVANLVVNARDAVGEKGHIWVSTANRQLSEEDCRLLPEAKPGRYVVLAVKDDGCGMDSEVLKRIFEPFFTTKGEGKGTGLGLATVFGIVKQNNGFIVVESEPGKGSTFEIYFPVVEGEKAEARDAAAPIPRGWETILLVEDQPEVLEAASSLLKQLGYQVLSAKSPEQALAVAASYQGVIHLLLSDVGLPGMSGSELAQRLVAVRPEMKVLMMTGYTQEAPLRTEAEKAWGPVLEKPLTAEALAHRVRQVLEGKA